MDIYSFLEQHNNARVGFNFELFINYNESYFTQDLDKAIFKLFSKISKIGFRFNEGKIIYNPLLEYKDGSRSFSVDDVNDTLRMYKNDDIRMYNFNCITDTIVEVITTCNTYTLLTVHLL